MYAEIAREFYVQHRPSYFCTDRNEATGKGRLFFDEITQVDIEHLSMDSRIYCEGFVIFDLIPAV